MQPLPGWKNFPMESAFWAAVCKHRTQRLRIGCGDFIIALLSPVLSSIADYKGNKKNSCASFVTPGASCSIMFFLSTMLPSGCLQLHVCRHRVLRQPGFYNSTRSNCSRIRPGPDQSAKGCRLRIYRQCIDATGWLCAGDADERHSGLRITFSHWSESGGLAFIDHALHVYPYRPKMNEKRKNMCW